MQKLWIRGLTITLALANLLPLCNSSGQANVVGYVNKQYPQGWSLIANPLNDVDGGNTLNSLFSPLENNLPDGTQLSKWTGSSYNTYTYDMIGWLDAGLNYVGSSVTLPPGIGAVLHTPALPPTTTWIGEVMGGATGRIPATPPASPGIYLLASTWPVASSSFADVVGRAPIEGEAVLKIDSLGSPTIVQFDFGIWVDSGFNPVADPVVGLAESAFFALGGADFANWALPVPEPGTFALLAVGAVILFRRRK